MGLSLCRELSPVSLAYRSSRASSSASSRDSSRTSSRQSHVLLVAAIEKVMHLLYTACMLTLHLPCLTLLQYLYDDLVVLLYFFY